MRITSRIQVNHSAYYITVTKSQSITRRVTKSNMVLLCHKAKSNMVLLCHVIKSITVRIRQLTISTVAQLRHVADTIATKTLSHTILGNAWTNLFYNINNLIVVRIMSNSHVNLVNHVTYYITWQIQINKFKGYINNPLNLPTLYYCICSSCMSDVDPDGDDVAEMILDPDVLADDADQVLETRGQSRKN